MPGIYVTLKAHPSREEDVDANPATYLIPSNRGFTTLLKIEPKV